jgi:hypothetical protein
MVIGIVHVLMNHVIMWKENLQLIVAEKEHCQKEILFCGFSKYKIMTVVSTNIM